MYKRICPFTLPYLHLYIFIPLCQRLIYLFFFFLQNRLRPPLPSLFSLCSCPPGPPNPQPPLKLSKRWRAEEGNHGGRHGSLAIFVPHFLQKMIDLANYPMLLSLSHTTSSRSYGGNQRSLAMCRIANAI